METTREAAQPLTIYYYDKNGAGTYEDIPARLVSTFVGALKLQGATIIAVLRTEKENHEHT